MKRTHPAQLGSRFGSWAPRGAARSCRGSAAAQQRAGAAGRAANWLCGRGKHSQVHASTHGVVHLACCSRPHPVEHSNPVLELSDVGAVCGQKKGSSGSAPPVCSQVSSQQAVHSDPMHPSVCVTHLSSSAWRSGCSCRGAAGAGAAWGSGALHACWLQTPCWRPYRSRCMCTVRCAPSRLWLAAMCTVRCAPPRLGLAAIPLATSAPAGALQQASQILSIHSRLLAIGARH